MINMVRKKFNILQFLSLLFPAMTPH